MWMLSTKMMPAVGALVPVYVMAQTAGLLDSLTALIVVFTLSNLPIMVDAVFLASRTSRLTSPRRRAWMAPTWGASSCTRDPPAGDGHAASTGLLCLGAELERGLWSST